MQLFDALKKSYFCRPSWISCRRKNAQHLQTGIHRTWTHSTR